MQPLMFANGLRLAARQMGAGYTFEKADIERRIEDFNSERSGSGKAFVGRERKDANFTLTFCIPAKAFDMMYKMYIDYTWPHSWMNSRVCSHPALVPGKKDPLARGPWQTVYTTTVSSVELTAEIEDSLWRERFPQPKELDDCSIQKVYDARPGFERLAKTSLRACLWVNWVEERVAAEAACIAGTTGTSDAVSNVRKMFMRGFFDDELDCLVTSRGNGPTYSIASLASLPSIQRAICGQSARLSDSEAMAQMNAAAGEKFKQLAAAIEGDKVTFEAAVKQHTEELGMEVLRGLKRATSEREKADNIINEFASTEGSAYTRATRCAWRSRP